MANKKPICVLSAEETAAFEEYGIVPVHAHHVHVCIADAMQYISQDRMRAVGDDCCCRCHQAQPEPMLLCELCQMNHGTQRIFAITEHSSNKYVWKNRMSGGQSVKQMVPIRG